MNCQVSDVYLIKGKLIHKSIFNVEHDLYTYDRYVFLESVSKFKMLLWQPVQILIIQHYELCFNGAIYFEASSGSLSMYNVLYIL